MLDWFRLSPSPRSRAAGVCLSGRGGHRRGPVSACVLARDGRPWGGRNVGKEASRLAGGEPHGQGARRRGLRTSRVFCSNRAGSLQQLFKVKSGFCASRVYTVPPWAPEDTARWVHDAPDVRLGIGVHQGDQGAPQRQGHDRSAPPPCPMTRGNATTGNRPQALGTVAEDARLGGDDGQG